MLMVAQGIKQEEEEHKSKTITFSQKIKVPKFLDPINFHRISGDFIIPDKFEQKGANELIYPFRLIHNFKYLKQIHLRKHGLIMEFDYLDHCGPAFSTIKLLEERLESLGNQFYHELAVKLKEYEIYNIKQQKFTHIKNVEKGSLNEVFNHFDNLLYRYKKEKLMFMGNEILSLSDFNLRFIGFNYNILREMSWEEEPDYFSESFINAMETFICFYDIETYFEMLRNFICNVIDKFKYKSKNDVFIHQLYSSIIGTHYRKMKIIEELLPNENIIIYGNMVENTSEEKVFSYFLEMKKQEFQKKSLAHKDVINIEHKGELLRLYYKKKKIKKEK